MPRTLPVESRFWANVEKTDSCWLWTASKMGFGYGKMSVNGKRERAHRISWRLHFGEIPAGTYVLHSCDVPACVNPNHLRLGTLRDNTQDMIAKGRDKFGGGVATQGERNGRARLTAEAVCEIRAAYPTTSQVDLAQRYGVSQVAISHVVLRKSWRHL
jgi:hypothetical protein